jgi:hypothetical protein
MIEQKTEPSLAVLVMSCDNYDDTWQPFIHFFEKNWAHCPYKIYFASNFRHPEHARFTPVLFEKSTTWSDELMTVLRKIPETHILYIQDDYFLLKAVSNEKIESLFRKMLANDAAYLRLFPCPPCDELLPGETEIGIIKPETEQRTSLQSAVWEKAVLLRLLKAAENPWQFEINAPRRSREIPKLFLSVPRTNQGRLEEGDYPLTYFCTAILKGKWMRGAYQLCKTEGIALDTNRRKVQSRYEVAKNRIWELTPKFLQGYMWFLLYRILP